MCSERCGVGQAGQEAFRSITRSYYRGAIGALLVYDVTRCVLSAARARWRDERADCDGQ